MAEKIGMIQAEHAPVFRKNLPKNPPKPVRTQNREIGRFGRSLLFRHAFADPRDMLMTP